MPIEAQFLKRNFEAQFLVFAIYYLPAIIMSDILGGNSDNDAHVLC